jgi:prophage maintenance system killer protein
MCISNPAYRSKPRNHPFYQGNKRTALVAALLFLDDCGYRFAVDDPPFFADLIRNAIDRKVTDENFVRIIRTFIAPK